MIIGLFARALSIRKDESATEIVGGYGFAETSIRPKRSTPTTKIIHRRFSLAHGLRENERELCRFERCR